MHFPLLALAVFLSFLPVFFWSVILWRRHRNSMLFFFILNFVLAMGLAAGFSYFLEFKVENWIQLRIPTGLGIFVSYLCSGILIEYGKNFIVRLTGKRYFKSVDDVMDMSFATALGFTFYINTFQFYQVFQGAFPEIEGPVKMLKYAVQSIFYILPAHILCSGIFGYFYGMSLFATEELKSQEKSAKFRYRLIAYRTMKILEGTFLSTIAYGIFFTILKFDPTIGDLTALMGLGRLIIMHTPIDEKIMPIFSFAFFSLGTVFLFQLLDHKRDLVREKLLEHEDPGLARPTVDNKAVVSKSVS